MGAKVAVVIVRALTAVGILIVTISSLVIVEQPEEDHTFLTNHFLLVPPVDSENGYKAELIILIILAGLALLTLPFAAISRVFAPLAGITAAGILVGNFIAFPTSHKLAAYLLAETDSIASWVCCGLGLMCAGTAFFGTATAGRVAAVLGAGAVVTGIAAAIVVAKAPDYGSYFNYGESELASSHQVVQLPTRHLLRG